MPSIPYPLPFLLCPVILPLPGEEVSERTTELPHLANFLFGGRM